jgi:hypothetical protein
MRPGMRRPGREFGSERPRVIYLALRWNAPRPMSDQEEHMINKVADKLRVRPEDLRIYNLVSPEKDRGMSLSINEFDDVAQTIRRIRLRISGCHRVRRVVVGGRSGPMPLVALLLELLIPRIRIEVRNHHAARAGRALDLVKVIRP